MWDKNISKNREPNRQFTNKEKHGNRVEPKKIIELVRIDI